MISLLIRLVMGKSYGSFWTGLVMLLVGISLTVGSYMLASSLGGVTIIFYGLIIAGVVRMILSAPALMNEGGRAYRGSLPYMTGGPGYPTGGPGYPMGEAPVLPYASPVREDPGRCWLCGGKVKHRATICLHCGASQGSQPQDSEIAQTAGYSMTSGSLVVPPSYRPPTAPPATWRYEPSAPAPRGPYSPPEPPRGPYSSPEPGYSPQSPPNPAFGQYSAPERRRGSRRPHSSPEMPLRIFEAPARPRRPSRREPYAGDPGGPGGWGPPPPRGGGRPR